MFDPSLMVQQGPNPGERFAQAFQQGTQQRDQNMAKAAYAALVRDPGNQKAFEALASVNPEAAQQFKQQQLEQAKAHLGAHYENVLKAGQILRQAKPHDQASWDQARAMAQQAGVDISEAPPVWDEHTAQYAQQISGLADVFAPLKPESDIQYMPLQQGGTVAAIDKRNNTASILVAPNDGSHPVGAAAGNVPHVSDQASYDAVPPGSQYLGPDGHMRVKQGGQTPPASGGF